MFLTRFSTSLELPELLCLLLVTINCSLIYPFYCSIVSFPLSLLLDNRVHLSMLFVLLNFSLFEIFKGSFFVVYCLVIKVLLAPLAFASARESAFIYYHIATALVKNFFHFFISFLDNLFCLNTRVQNTLYIYSELLCFDIFLSDGFYLITAVSNCQ